MQKKTLYFLLQVLGWFTYVGIINLLTFLQGNGSEEMLLFKSFIAFVIGVGTTHLYREIIIHFGWTEMNIMKLIPRVIISSIFFAFVSSFPLLISLSIFTGKPLVIEWSGLLFNMITWASLFIFWSLVYFTYHFFERFRISEIKNLKWEATKNEIELNKLKSQLNPHFIFNSMNTIRALIDEDPIKAKKSITQLSHILRLTLLMSTKKTVSFEDEMHVVKDYLEIEKVRYEERLMYKFDIDENSYKFQIPSMILQTLVENGIKHGISKLPKGGLLFLKTKEIDCKLHITIENTGQLSSNSSPETGFGLVNTRQRLNILYGNCAEFSIRNKDGNTVITSIVIPLESN